MYDTDKITFLGSSTASGGLSHLDPPYQCFYKFEVYSRQENTEKLTDEPDLGATGNVVVRLLRGVPRKQNHIIYFDNFYTSLSLVVFLAKSGIHTLGTVQQNRIPNTKLPEKKNFMKTFVPRGSFEERVSVHDGIDLSCVS